MTAAKIESLSAEQMAALTAHADAWIARAFSTDPVSDEERAAQASAIKTIYTAAGLPEPELWVRCRSPLSGGICVGLLSNKDSVRDSVRDSVGDSVGDSVWDSVGASVWDSVRDLVWDSVWASVRERFDPWAGYYGSCWIAWAQAYQHIVGVTLPEHTAALLDAWDAAHTLGWWWPREGAVVTVDRPTVLTTEVTAGVHRLHNELGPAVAWADGYALHFWHGTRVPADLIEGDPWPVERILREPNTEVRRCAIERMGWAEFVVAAGLTQVGDTQPDPGNPGHELALYDLPEQIFDEPVRVLLCANATPERDGQRRRFGLTVPGSIGDPIAAAGWTFGLSPVEYRALERAT